MLRGVRIKPDNFRRSWSSRAVCSAAVSFAETLCLWTWACEQPVLDSRAGTQGLWFRLMFFLVFWVGWWGCFSSNSPKTKHYKAILIYTAWPVYFSSWSNKPNCFMQHYAFLFWECCSCSCAETPWAVEVSVAVNHHSFMELCPTRRTNCMEPPGSVHLGQVVCWTEALQGVLWWGDTCNWERTWKMWGLMNLPVQGSVYSCLSAVGKGRW